MFGYSGLGKADLFDDVSANTPWAGHQKRDDPHPRRMRKRLGNRRDGINVY